MLGNEDAEEQVDQPRNDYQWDYLVGDPQIPKGIAGFHHEDYHIDETGVDRLSYQGFYHQRTHAVWFGLMPLHPREQFNGKGKDVVDGCGQRGHKSWYQIGPDLVLESDSRRQCCFFSMPQFDADKWG